MRASLLAAFVCVAACGVDPQPPPVSDEDACDLLEMGPYVGVTATVGRDDGTPSIADDDQTYTVELTATGYGYVRFATSGGFKVLYLDRGVTVNVLEGGGIPAGLRSATTSDACATIKGRHEVSLEAGVVYIGLASDGGAPVNLVVK